MDDVDDKADAFVLTGRGAHIKRTYERLEAQQAKEEAAEEERLRRIKYFRAMMAEEKARAEREAAGLPGPGALIENQQISPS